VVLLLGALLRLSHVVAIRDAPWLQHMQLDHRIYDEWGQRIAAGDWVGTHAYFVDPLYAYFLGIIYCVAGHRPIVVLVIQAVLGVGTCYLTCVLGRRAFGPRLGSLACLVMVLYGPAIYYEALVEKTALSLFLFTLSLVLFFEQTRRRITLAGVALGLAALTRGNFLMFIPIGTVALLLRNPSSQTDPSGDTEHPLAARLVSRIRMNNEIAGRFLMASFLVVSDEYYRALRGLFVQAGWVIRREDRVPFALKPGLFLFAADEHPPADVTAIQTAFMSAGINITFNTGYRSYYQEMKRTRPAWNGIAMSPDQTFTIVVGPLQSRLNRR
jgi:hypothetical protein